MNRNSNHWIKKLRLKKHPEGGFYREIFRSPESIRSGCLPRRFKERRSLAASILFLLPGNQISALHRLKADEIWHFFAGSPLTLHVLTPAGQYRTIRLGPESHFQSVVPHGCWFGATVSQASSFALVGCTTAPGFDFQDFELASRQRLLSRYPRHRRIIRKLTRA